MAIFRGKKSRRVVWKEGEKPRSRPAYPPSCGPIKFGDGERDMATPGSLWVAAVDMIPDANFSDPTRWVQSPYPYLIPSNWGSAPVKKGMPALYMGETRVEEADSTGAPVRMLRALLLIGTKMYIVTNMSLFSPTGAKAAGEEV